MDDLIAWLRAQLDDDERVARQMTAEPCGFYIEAETADTNIMTVGAHVYRWTPKRVLAEVDAKRRILVEIFGYEAKIDGEWGCCHSAADIGAGKCPEIDINEIAALRILALPYAGRDGYRDEWRP